MKQAFWSGVVVLLMAGVIRAELPPSVYEAKQKEAPEKIGIEVLRVDIESGEQADQQKVGVVALVTRVDRTASGLQPDQVINISYVITERPRGFVGPGEIPLLQEGEKTVAFLVREDSGPVYLPVAGIMSFREF